MTNIKNPTLVAFAALAMLSTFGCDDAEDSNIEDRSVEVAVVVDGIRYEAEEMDQFEGEVLHYLVDPAAQAEGVMYAFSSEDDRAAFVQEREPAILAYEAEQLQFRAPLTNSKFFDLVDYDDKFGELKVGESISNLAAHPGYNDNDISSVKCRVNAYTFLWDATNFGGSSLICRAINIPDLGVHGFNQRASSLEVTP